MIHAVGLQIKVVIDGRFDKSSSVAVISGTPLPALCSAEQL